MSPSTAKVDRRARPDESPQRSAQLSGARGETVSFQIALHADRVHARGIDAHPLPLLHEAGHTLPASAITLFRAYYLYILQPTGGYAWIEPAEHPDPLLPLRDPTDPTQGYGAPFDHTRIGSAAKPFVLDRQDKAHLFTTGHYTGDTDRNWVVQIDRGGPPGQATFRWSDSDQRLYDRSGGFSLGQLRPKEIRRRWEATEGYGAGKSWTTLRRFRQMMRGHYDSRHGFDTTVAVKAWNEENRIIPDLAGGTRTDPIALADGAAIFFTAAPGAKFVAGETYHFRTYRAMNEALWVDVAIPFDAVPGTYTGTVVLTSSDHDLPAIPVTLTVWDITLPRPRSIATAFAGWMAASFYVDNPEANQQFEFLLHDHGIDTQTIHGHRTYWQHNYEKIDWTSFDRAAAPRLDGSYFPDRVPLNRFHLGMYGPGNEWHWTGAARESVENVERYAREFARHLKDRDWFDRVYVYCRDEPSAHHIPGIVRDIHAFLRADPDWRGKFMVTSAPQPDSPLLDLIDIWCVKYHWWIPPDLKQDLLDDGRIFWGYVANMPHQPNPTYHIESRRGYEARLIKWASWAIPAEGFLYWAAALDQAYPNPWVTAFNQFGAVGDANLIYYGARNGPALGDDGTPLRPIMAALPSYRLKQIRNGLDDWELLRLAEAKVGREAVMDILRTVYRSPGGGYGQKISDQDLDRAWTQDDHAILRAREAIVALILGGGED